MVFIVSLGDCFARCLDFPPSQGPNTSFLNFKILRPPPLLLIGYVPGLRSLPQTFGVFRMTLFLSGWVFCLEPPLSGDTFASVYCFKCFTLPQTVLNVVFRLPPFWIIVLMLQTSSNPLLFFSCPSGPRANQIS